MLLWSDANISCYVNVSFPNRRTCYSYHLLLSAAFSCAVMIWYYDLLQSSDFVMQYIVFVWYWHITILSVYYLIVKYWCPLPISSPTVPWRAIPNHLLQCRAEPSISHIITMPGRAIPSHTVPWLTIPSRTVPRHTIPNHPISRCTLQRTVPCHVGPSYAALCPPSISRYLRLFLTVVVG
jgi:hypothetical protein